MSEELLIKVGIVLPYSRPSAKLPSFRRCVFSLDAFTLVETIKDPVRFYLLEIIGFAENAADGSLQCFLFTFIIVIRGEESVSTSLAALKGRILDIAT